MLLLSAEEVQQLNVLELAGQRRLVFSAQQAWVADGRLQLRGLATAPLQASVFPALPKPRAAGLNVTQDGLLTVVTGQDEAAEADCAHYAKESAA